MQYENLSEVNRISKIIEEKQSVIDYCANAYSIDVKSSYNYNYLSIDIDSGSENIYRDYGDELINSITKLLEQDIKELKSELVKL